MGYRADFFRKRASKDARLVVKVKPRKAGSGGFLPFLGDHGTAEVRPEAGLDRGIGRTSRRADSNAGAVDDEPMVAQGAPGTAGLAARAHPSRRIPLLIGGGDHHARERAIGGDPGAANLVGEVRPKAAVEGRDQSLADGHVMLGLD